MEETFYSRRRFIRDKLHHLNPSNNIEKFWTWEKICGLDGQGRGDSRNFQGWSLIGGSFRGIVKELKTRKKVKKIYQTKTDSKRLIHVDEKTNEEIYIMNSKFGIVLKKGKQFINLSKKEKIDIDKITYEEAMAISYPRKIGEHNNSDIILNNGKYGEYIQYNGKNISMKKIKSNDIKKIKEYFDISK